MKTGSRDASAEAAGTTQDVFLGVLQLAGVLTHGLSDTLKPFRLTLAQYNVLLALRRTEPDGLGCREVGERLVSRDPDITRLLDRLEVRGFVSRHRERPDRRVVRAQITRQGLELLEKLDELTEKLRVRHLGHLGPRQLEAFKALLEATAEAS